MGKRDYYDVLGVPRHAGPQEVRAAFRRLARRYSPDVNFWDMRATELFEEISEAYGVLGDPTARALYDRLGHRVFEPMGQWQGEHRARGDDIHYPIEIDLDDALRGVSAIVDVTRHERCAACHGTGRTEGPQRPASCPVCNGAPLQVAVRRGIPVMGPCPNCGGSGRDLPRPCPACRGRATVAGHARVGVRIPPGVDTGSEIRVHGEGHAAPVPGERGDLVVIARVRPHGFFIRKGDNLYCEVPVTVPEAALGARIQIPTPDGPAVLTLPAGTQSGRVFRLRGRGCPRLDRDGRGDLFVTTHVMIPCNADSTLEEVLRALQRLLPANPRAELWSRAGGQR